MLTSEAIAYMSEIKRFPLLSAVAERELFERYQRERSLHLRNYLVECNLGLAISCAKKYFSKADPIDLIQEANIGLIRAVEAYNPAHNTRFSTYAVFPIRQQLSLFLQERAGPIKFPSRVLGQITAIHRAVRALEAVSGHTPEPCAVATYTGFEPREVIHLTAFMEPPLYLSQQHDTPHGDETQEFGETLADPGTVLTPDFSASLIHARPSASLSGPLQALRERATLRELQQALMTLTPCEREIIERYHGLGTYTATPIVEIGRVMGLRRQTVSLRYKRAVEKLYQRLAPTRVAA